MIDKLSLYNQLLEYLEERIILKKYDNTNSLKASSATMTYLWPPNVSSSVMSYLLTSVYMTSAGVSWFLTWPR